MGRYFNITGPVNPAEHYIVPPLSRIDLDVLNRLIEEKRYFVLHAPRQSGKTTLLLALEDLLNESGRFRALYINVEGGQTAKNSVTGAIRGIVSQIAEQARDILGDPFPESARRRALQAGPHDALRSLLTAWSGNEPERPVILIIDEIDSLIGESLVAVLRQIRSGYVDRPRRFPQSVILCGVRDIRDYRLRLDDGQPLVTGGSAFNIVAKSLRIGDFSKAEVESLYRQHTAETGQEFTQEAIDRAFELTQGQPWLVNALAYEACFEMEEGRDRTRPITIDLIDTAKEHLIISRVTHLDQLADKLNEPRVRRIVEPLIRGGTIEGAMRDDLDYVVDLGLLRRTPNGPVVANPIYREVIPRELGATVQTSFETVQQPAWYVRPDGRLDISKLLAAFQQFFREHSEAWLARFDYQEAGPHILLQAFLQRIVNGGGQIVREYGLGRGRADLLILWNIAGDPSRQQRAVIELKIRRGHLTRTITQGITQTREYLDRSGAEEGHLVIFDRTPDLPWSKKIFRRKREGITIWGM